MELGRLRLSSECSNDDRGRRYLAGELARLRLSAGVQQRLTELLDKQATGTTLTNAERYEIEGLIDLAELLSLPRLRSERMSSRSG
jgi:hypothetical protein